MLHAVSPLRSHPVIHEIKIRMQNGRRPSDRLYTFWGSFPCCSVARVCCARVLRAVAGSGIAMLQRLFPFFREIATCRCGARLGAANRITLPRCSHLQLEYSLRLCVQLHIGSK